MFCSCPAASAINSIPIENCPERIGQIQKVVFQRVFSSAGVKNSLTIASANPNLLATWTTLLAATNSTKVVQSPFLSNPVFEPGAARRYGGGNATIGGIETIVGREPTSFTAAFLNTSQKSIKALKALMCEGDGAYNLGVYLIDEFGRIIGISNNITTPTIFYPIPAASLFLSDKKLGGIEEPDMNMMEVNLYPNWSDNIHIVTPTDFDALTALVTP